MLKGKRYFITDKSAMIASIKCLESQANMCHDNGVPESTFCWFLRDKMKLHDSVFMVDSSDWIKKGQNCQ